MRMRKHEEGGLAGFRLLLAEVPDCILPPIGRERDGAGCQYSCLQVSLHISLTYV